MKHLTTLALITISLLACRSPQTNNPFEGELNPKLSEFHNRVKDVFNKPEKPSQISVLLEMTGTPLMTEIMNDPDNWKKYTKDDIRAAANLGVYMADALVQYAYDSINRAYQSMSATKALAGQIGIGEEVFMNLVEDRYTEEDRKSDSLFFKLDTILAKTDSSLTSDKRFRLLAAIYVGNYIEKQYIVANMIFNFQADPSKEADLFELRELMLIYSYFSSRLDYLIELTETAETIDDPGFLSSELKDLSNSIDNRRFTDEDLYSITPEMIFNNQVLLKEYEMIERMRNFIVDTEPEEKEI